MINIEVKATEDQAPQILVAIQNTLISGGSTSAGEFRNATIETTTSATVSNEYIVSQDFLQEISATNESGNSDISDFPIIRKTTGFTGKDSVMVHRGIWKRQLNVDFANRSGQDVVKSTGIKTGTNYLRYSYDWLNALVTAGGQAEIFTSGGLRNSACWAASLDLTGIPFSNSNNPTGMEKNGAMITPQHIAGCYHYTMEIGDTYTFKDAINNITTRTVIGRSERSEITGDARVYALSAPVAAGIAVYPVAGRWLFVTSEVGSTFTTASQFCGFASNRFRQAALVRVCHFEAGAAAKISGTVGGVPLTDFVNDFQFDAYWPEILIPEFDTLAPKYIGTSAGTSGSPVFVKVASGLAFASAFGSGLRGWFPDEAFTNALIRSANTNAVANGFTRPTDYTVTVAASPI